MATPSRGIGNRARINTTSRGPVNPDVVRHIDLQNDQLGGNGGDPAQTPRASFQPARIQRIDRTRRTDQGDGAR